MFLFFGGALFSQFDENYDNLVGLIRSYCSFLRSTWTTPWKRVQKTNELWQTMRQLLPKLSADLQFVDTTQPVFAMQRMIEYGAQSLLDINWVHWWKGYYLRGQSVDLIAEESNYSSTTLRRKMRDFPDRIAYELWMREIELAYISTSTPKDQIDPRTRALEYKRFVMNTFLLSDREADVVLAFCESGPDVGRGAILEKLCISKNTLKTHIRSITRKLNVRTMNEAVSTVKDLFEKKSMGD